MTLQCIPSHFLAPVRSPRDRWMARYARTRAYATIPHVCLETTQVRQWETTTGRSISTLNTEAGGVLAVAYSPDGSEGGVLF